MVITTEFDNPLEQDIVFEETDETQSFEDILKNSENMLKSFMYLKKLFNGTPLLNKILKLETIEYSEKTLYTIEPTANMVMIKNVDNVNGSMFLNDGELILLPFESFEFPYIQGAQIEVQGKLSIVQSEYNIS